jgi:orotidine-5'-phosphate decarboxylase
VTREPRSSLCRNEKVRRGIEIAYDRNMAPSVSPSPAAAAQTPAQSNDPLVSARRRLIVALDVPDASSALELVRRLEGTCTWFKVGLELFVAAGPAVLEPILSAGHSVFLDLKFHDIPNTVAGAVRSAASLGARMMTVHASGGPAMLAAARKALEGVTNPPQLLAVTMLTSMDAGQMTAVGFERSPSDEVKLLAQMAFNAGLRGFVCSPQEVTAVRALAGPDATLVVPGIRPAGSDAGDQKRIATPADTLRMGASFLVVGRPITQAADPAAAASAILNEMATVSS